MAEIDSYDADISARIEALGRNIDSISKKDPSQRPKLIQKCQNELKQIRMDIEAYELDIETQRRKDLADSLNNLRDRWGRLQTELDFKRSENMNANALYAERSRQKPLNELNGEELVALGDEVQGKSKCAAYTSFDLNRCQCCDKNEATSCRRS
eukprot:TRINITY_DN1657_c0_g1_i4.p1 TRINITY_DN1657_c0_g1~~TRINITY_DN1657_c0_g1_i4.p1  ORF type:complete len:154 (-),score=32.18 TRINITY_DN1657_c0_g1_i4:316-777(-)